MVHPMLVDNSIWSSCRDRSIACWQGRWAVLLTNRGRVEFLMRHGLTSAVHPMMAAGSGRGSCCGRHSTCWKEDGQFLQTTKATWSPGFSEAWLPQWSWCWWVARMHAHFICASLVALAWKEGPCSRRMVFILCNLWRCHGPPGYMVWAPSEPFGFLLNGQLP
ncbi:uncharacterized protein LOC100894745 isoform X2 [Callithrix jacchus]